MFQGLFRIAAGASKLKKLKAALDCSTSQLEEFYSDPHAVAGASQNHVSLYGTGDFFSNKNICECGFRGTEVLPEGTP